MGVAGVGRLEGGKGSGGGCGPAREGGGGDDGPGLLVGHGGERKVLDGNAVSSWPGHIGAHAPEDKRPTHRRLPRAASPQRQPAARQRTRPLVSHGGLRHWQLTTTTGRLRPG